MLKIQTCVLKVNIHCEDCKNKVRKILQKIEGVYTTIIDIDSKKVTVMGNVDPTMLTKALIKKGKRAEIWDAETSLSNINKNGGKKNGDAIASNQSKKKDEDDDHDHVHRPILVISGENPFNQKQQCAVGKMNQQPSFDIESFQPYMNQHSAVSPYMLHPYPKQSNPYMYALDDENFSCCNIM